jgi:sortase A
MRQSASWVLVVLGVVLLLFVAVEYGQMYLQQRHLAREWERQQHETKNQPHETSDATDDGLTRISVPKIDLDSVVVEGTNHRALLLGPGHMSETPVPGAEGNAVITGHRDTFFRHINELDKGDILTVQRAGRTYQYKVIGKKVVEPTDISVIRPTKDPEMTLITCYPTYYIGPAPKRLVVFSKLVKDGDAQSAAAAAGAR